MNKKASYYMLDRITTRMAKEFDTIANGEEEPYVMMLQTMEGNMMKQIHPILTEQYGENGYFNFIESQTGQLVDDDDKMHFTCKLGEEGIKKLNIDLPENRKGTFKSGVISTAR